ncbi:hypothetical protein AVEN_270070-1 [Araneus ventricosus]|uniref:Reverse transcriptase domain-containing protein n=1 Tax=Araneus ventricosus TaxID=182803 RepID=A0A4Y2MSL5_ARAVE|nr:hypothetical protein AVEN_270070-1 [Araneus ventricosus]
MSLNVHFLDSRLDYFHENLGAVSEEQGERIHRYIKEMEIRYQGKWNVSMIADYCWILQRDNPCKVHKKKTDKRTFESDLDCLFKWCTVNKLHLNIEKCSILSYTRKAQSLNHVYKINDLVLSRSDSVTDLGIIFDTKLVFFQHIDSMVSKAYRRLGILKLKTIEFSSEIALKVLYSAHVRSSLECCSIAWDPNRIKT